jgi:ethanolamine ammonia-lyase large subunit
VPYEEDEVTRLIFDSHDRDAFSPISHMTVGDFRDWSLSSSVDGGALTSVAAGITPEMVAAVSKLMRHKRLRG